MDHISFLRECGYDVLLADFAHFTTPEVDWAKIVNTDNDKLVKFLIEFNDEDIKSIFTFCGNAVAIPQGKYFDIPRIQLKDAKPLLSRPKRSVKQRISSFLPQSLKDKIKKIL